jgi:RNA polymerase sigma-70 factor (sigma-E family)
VERSSEFEEFVAAETPRLLRLAVALTGSPHDAWDLVQESLVRVGVRWRKLADGNPGGYAQTTLVRLNIDRHRRRRRERPRSTSGDAPVEVEHPLDPELVEALRQLPPQQRTAVVLRCLVDLDHAGIADHLGCSVGTARSHLSRGLARMRQHLEVVT